MSGYHPGYCNIGRRQRRKRLLVAIVAFLAALVYLLAYSEGLLPPPLLIGVFIPLSIGFEWFIQAYTAFCVRLALLNRYNFRGDGGEAGTVSDPHSQRVDQVQAAKITSVAIGLAAVTTGILVFLPL